MKSIKIKAPKEYINAPGLLRQSGNLLREYGKNALIVASPKSVSAAGQALFPSMEEAGIERTVSMFSGYVTFEKTENIANQHGNAGIDMVIGLGGGRVIDTAKIAATLLKVPAITVPTIAATCAAWAAVSIVYDGDGKYKDAFFNTIGPELVLADARILMEAPRRFLNAGIIDSLAKWYEIHPYQQIEGNAIFLRTMTLVCEQLKEILEKEADTVFFSDDAAMGVIDAVIYLAGLSGSLRTDTLYHGIAHPFYYVLTKYPESHSMLHGEIVGFGLLLQQVLERKSDEEIGETIRLFGKFQNALTLADLGLEGKRNILLKIAEDLYNSYHSSLNRLGYGYSADEIYRAILETDSLTRRHRANVSSAPDIRRP
ncbi:MAG: iron-containing alcohol dehydrogenase [Synergistaceae bacterium]|jgi:glycerol dehydrogenase|nr:iron-containing alcohol dehydrogenase [Synergistaceae bacterium]